MGSLRQGQQSLPFHHAPVGRAEGIWPNGHLEGVPSSEIRDDHFIMGGRQRAVGQKSSISPGSGWRGKTPQDRRDTNAGEQRQYGAYPVGKPVDRKSTRLNSSH